MTSFPSIAEIVPSPKVTDVEGLQAYCAAARSRGLRVAWTNGCFDLLHFGHLRTLQMARTCGDMLVVGVNADETVRRIKGPGRPLVPLSERMELLAALDCVDRVIAFSEPTPEAVIRQIRPDVCCKGEDYAPPLGKPIPEAEAVVEYGGRVVFLPLATGWSTTSLIHRIRATPE